MFASHTATGLTVALLALPATATAQSTQSLSDRYGWGQTASTLPQDLRGPDAADVARAGEIATAMARYERSQPAPVAAASDGTPVWPEIAFAGVVALAGAGGVVRVRARRSRRVAA